MRFGTVDLGTNSVRFDVHQLHPNGSLERIHREKLMVRLGHGVFVSGTLNPAAVRRTLQAFQSFRQTAEILKVSQLSAFATASLREASDSDDFIRTVFEETAIRVEVISGAKEAELIALGVLKNERIPKGRSLLVDIGGGSTEVTLCEGRKILGSHSFDLGAARLQQLFLKEHPPGKKAIEALKTHVAKVLGDKIKEQDWPSVPLLLGSSGTIRALIRVCRKEGVQKKTLDPKALKKCVQKFAPMTMRKLFEVEGLEKKRADIILAGAILLEAVVEAFEVEEIHTTEFSMRDGLLERERRRIKSRDPKNDPAERGDVFRFVQRMTPDQAHPVKVEEIALKIFADLGHVHRLKSRWSFILSASALLHDVGESINPVHHWSHSYYAVMNGDFGYVEDWVRELLANLCLLHQSGKIRAEHLEFAAKDRHIEGFQICLAILRVADALDRSRKGLVLVDKVIANDEAVELYLESEFDIGLEVLRLEQKKELFEAVFQKPLRVRVDGVLQSIK